MTQTTDIASLTHMARQAMSQRDWNAVARLSDAILQQDPGSDDGLFIKGVLARLGRNLEASQDFFRRALAANGQRHDAAIELANIYSRLRRNGDAAALIRKYSPLIQNSPKYLDLAGTISVEIGMPETAWPLYKRANILQPDAPLLMANLANCATYMGETGLAAELYEKLIAGNPKHRQNHYHYSRVRKANSEDHIVQMKALLEDKTVPDNRNTPILYSIAKEYEDLKKWDQAFEFYAKANSSVSAQLNYNPGPDIELLDHIQKKCDQTWLSNGDAKSNQPPVPIFIAGLPRTGTTLVERIIGSHSQVSSLGETMFVQQSARQISPDQPNLFTPEGFDGFADNCEDLPNKYLAMADYRLAATPHFIEKLPLNFMFLGPIAKAWPSAKIVVLKRGAMDTCFSMYKQVFTWAYKFSYDLEHIGRYYVAYDNLMKHWKALLGDRVVDVDYETLARNPGQEIPKLIESLGLGFEEACLNFHLNERASTSASSVQVRSKINTGSIGRWRHFEDQLQPLQMILQNAGIAI
ncbi:MAG: hypothetical protein HKN36_03190 [Hellea sp.]|nr:hypothetical protein [Hellea sp.]